MGDTCIVFALLTHEKNARTGKKVNNYKKKKRRYTGKGKNGLTVVKEGGTSNKFPLSWTKKDRCRTEIKHVLGGTRKSPADLSLQRGSYAKQRSE